MKKLPQEVQALPRLGLFLLATLGKSQEINNDKYCKFLR